MIFCLAGLFYNFILCFFKLSKSYKSWRKWVKIYIGALLALTAIGCSPVNKESSHTQKVTHLNVTFDKFFGGNYYKINSALEFVKSLENQHTASKINSDKDGTKIINAYGCMTYTFDKPEELNQVIKSINLIYNLPHDLMTQLNNGLQLNENQHLQDFNMNANSNAARGVSRQIYKKPNYCKPLPDYQHTTTSFYKQIQGVDSNKNGIRDEVENMIKQDLGGREVRKAVLMYARAIQRQISYDYRITDNYRKMAKELLETRQCVVNNFNTELENIFQSKYVNGNDKLGSAYAQQYLDMISSMTIDTQLRKDALSLHQYAALKTPLPPMNITGCPALSETDPLSSTLM